MKMDTDNVSHYIHKIKSLLTNALKPNFEVNLNFLLLHLSSDENKEVSKKLVDLNIFTEWIIETCIFWEKHENVEPSTNLACFVLELASLISKDENHFLQLSSVNIYLKLCDFVQVRRYSCAIQIKIAYIKLLESFLEHRSGVEWIKATNSWIDVLKFCLKKDLRPDGYRFMYKLLESKIYYDEAFCDAVVKKIIAPLNLSDLSTEDYKFFQLAQILCYYISSSCGIVIVPPDEEDEMYTYRIKYLLKLKEFNNSLKSGNPSHNKEIDELQLKNEITPILQLIIDLLEKYLENEWNSKCYEHIPTTFIVKNNLLQIVESYILFLNDTDLNRDFTNIAYLIYFIILCIHSKGNMITETESTPVFEKVFFLMVVAIHKQHCMNVVQLSHFAIKYWFLIHTRLLPITHKDVNKKPALFQTQMLLIQTTPICQFFEDYFKMDYNVEDMDVMRADCCQKIYERMNEYFIRFLYSFREKMIDNKISTYKSATEYIKLMLKSRKYYDIEAAILAFQMMVYVLHDIIEITKKDPVEFKIANSETDIFLGTVCLLRELINYFDINWTNCVESVCVVSSTLNFLLFTTWPVQLTIEGLQLLNLAIQKYMSPNLTLLVDRTNDSSLSQLGPLLRSKLEDNHWEIREKCLQVLITISELSYNKFPSFQELLQIENFPHLVLQLCENDSESFVRASALKCLQHMIKGDVLWKEFFEQEQLPEKIMKILGTETEGFVRSEVVAFLCLLNVHQCFGKPKMSALYKLMASAATLDLHWEVKIKALGFWNNVIWESLKDQGMIDKAFPEVTFSKESRKIIVLNDNEIKRRLKMVISDLNSIGCLHVLTKAIQEDSDIEVAEEAMRTTKKFVAILKKYNMVNCVDAESICPNQDFFNLIQHDLDRIIENRKKWLIEKDNFEIVLNNILQDLEVGQDAHTIADN